ncbi:winged helix-turn-helix transcriptional regulator [Candidatus Woesearchaeota archaeon]|nr:winged helix-turn-helix transcriptional regulator [Candidatus Woesearchaeota archaeon]
MAKEKFVMVSLKEESAKRLANVISNDTSRRILDALADGDLTETEIAKKLGLPLSTVHYNLTHLRKARLVEVDEFHYSSKGKEVNHYKLANKFIIIAPKETASMDKLKERLQRILPVSAVLLAAAWAINAAAPLFSGVGYGGASEALSAAAPEMLKAPLGIAEKAAADTAAAGAGEMLSEAAVPAALDTAQEAAVFATRDALVAAAPQRVAEAVSPSTSLLGSIAFWFVIGGIAAIVLYMVFDLLFRRLARD